MKKTFRALSFVLAIIVCAAIAHHVFTYEAYPGALPVLPN